MPSCSSSWPQLCYLSLAAVHSCAWPRLKTTRRRQPSPVGVQASATGSQEMQMKLISAIIKPHMLDEVRDGLAKAGVQGLTVTEVKGFGRQKGHTEIYRGAEYTVDFVPKMKLDTVVGDELVEAATTAIIEAARTGSIGDGKVFVSDVGQAIRIRTGEIGDEAL